MLTLFELLVVNNWHDIMGVVVELTSDWSVLYFISWYVRSIPQHVYAPSTLRHV